MTNRRAKPSSSGFTLVELLVVISIIGVLASLISLGVSHALDAGNAAVCRSNLRYLGLALERDYIKKLKIPADLRIADSQNKSSTPNEPQIRMAGFFPLLADVPPLPQPPPPPPPPPPPWNRGELGRMDCPLAEANPVYVLDPDNEPETRSFGIRHAALGRSLTSGGWLLAESDLRHIKRTEDLAARHNERLHVYRIGGSVERFTPDEVKFPTP